ncbi:hypothetical protein V3851_25735 [Paenibacillus sp. M1]|uniref:Uncharacterized protein n=1 Tax=Paenibacillus haidiansis TaxID=1574488 RepID=A0ABU7W1Z0_9BACL
MIKLLPLFIFISMLSGPHSSFSNGQSDQLRIDPSAIHQKTSLDVNSDIIQLEPIHPRGLDGNSPKAEFKQESKIIFNIQEENERIGPEEPIPVQIVLTDNEDAEQKFTEEMESAFGKDIAYDKAGYKTFDLMADFEQLMIMASFSSVQYIFKQPESDSEVYISGSCFRYFFT